jgi:alkaline phosphatase D
MTSATRIAALAGLSLAIATTLVAADVEPITHGPFLGHAGTTEAVVWARFAQAGVYTLTLTDEATGEPAGDPLTGLASEAADYCVIWRATGLEPGRRYTCALAARDVRIAPDFALRTAPRDDSSDPVVLGFGSCASDSRYPSQPIWNRIDEDGVEAMVLLGDTPYIDSTELGVQRTRYREFYEVPELAATRLRMPFYATWDDHDFGKNDTDGNLAGKEFSRQAFIEYHANPTYGSRREGIYTNFRRGPVEVFLLDTRWFAATEPAPFDEEKQTLLGRAQWDWLRDALADSSAPFKLIACGMVWNGAVRPNKPDHWMSYPHERQALFQFLGDERIGGVVLIGGDIHRTRSLMYPTRSVVGYDVTELITSPLANSIIETANAPSPHLLFDVGDTQTYLRVTADRSQLRAEFRALDGTSHYTATFSATDLTAAE